MRSDRITCLISVSILAAALAGCRRTPEAVAVPTSRAATAASVTKNNKALTPEQIRERDAYIQRALAKKHHAGTTAVASAATEHAHPAHKAVPGSHAAGDDDARAAKRRKAQDEAELRAMESTVPKGELTSGHFTAPGLGDPPPQAEVPPAPAEASRGAAAPAASSSPAASQISAGDEGSAGQSSEGPGQPGGRKGNHSTPNRTAHHTTRHYRPVTHLPRVNFGPTKGMTQPVHRLP